MKESWELAEDFWRIEMNANELADKVIEVLGEFWLSTECATMLRQQHADLKDSDKYALELERLYEDAKAEIDFLKKEILAKHEDWKHEGQQAEIEALKLHNKKLQWALAQQTNLLGVKK